MSQVFHFYGEPTEHTPLDPPHVGLDDVRIGIADRRGYVGQEPTSVRTLHEKPHEEAVILLGRPFDLNPPVFRQVEDVRAVHLVDRHAAPLRDVAHDSIPRHRLAAPRITDHQVVHALDSYGTVRATDTIGDTFQLRGRAVDHVVWVLIGIERPNEGRGPHVPSAEGGQHLLELRESEALRGLFRLGLRRLASARLSDLPVEEILSELEGRVVLLFPDPLADTSASTRCPDEREPVLARALPGIGDDLHCVAILEFTRER